MHEFVESEHYHTAILLRFINNKGGMNLTVDLTPENARFMIASLVETLYRREKPEVQILPLGHHEFVQRVSNVAASILGEGPLVRLYGEVEAHPERPVGVGQRREATTLAIRMDRVAANSLAQQILRLDRQMGYPPVAESR